MITFEKNNISLKNVNIKKNIYNSKINIKSNKSNKINYIKTFTKCYSFKSTKNKTINIFGNKTFNKQRSLKLQRIFNN